MSTASDLDTLPHILDFVRGIGLRVIEGPLQAPAFLPGIEIRCGELVVDRLRLQWPADVLHEAGHLAVMPASLRALQSGNLHDCEDVPHAGEAEAMAWAYAAACAIGLPAEALFHAGGYQGWGRQLALTFACGVYPGLHGLSEAGMALGIRQAESAGVPAYPHMLRWLRD